MIVLDTHAWIWWLSNPENLSERGRAIIKEAVNNNGVYISSISAWEMAMLVLRGRLKLTMNVRDWISIAESLPFLHFVPIDNNIAIKSVELPDFEYTDPADRIIIATATILKATLITKDVRILNYPRVKAVW